MTSKFKTAGIAVLAAALICGILLLNNNTTITGSATQGNMITATGSFGGELAGTSTMTFPAKGGPVTGSFTGTYQERGATINYFGNLAGNYAGGEGGQIQGSLKGKIEAIVGNRKYVDPLTGTFGGAASLNQGTAKGTWTSNRIKGTFNLKFSPALTAGTGQPTRGTTGTGSTGYCRCITGPYEGGAFINYYGGKGLEFKGFTTLDSCVQTCQGKHSWIPIKT